MSINKERLSKMIETITAVATTAITSGSLLVATVNLDKAQLCTEQMCHPVLVGKNTPKGEFPIVYSKTESPGYKGDVLAFKRDFNGVYAIHRVWTLKPSENRLERIKRGSEQRLITNGCINVSDELYEELKSYSRVIIK